MIGGNPSEDPDAQNEATGGVDSTVEMETDVVADYRLVETSYNKKQYQAHLKVSRSLMDLISLISLCSCMETSTVYIKVTIFNLSVGGGL